MGQQFTAHDIRRIAVEARRSIPTVLNVLKGKRTKPVAELSVREAADRLGYVLPPPSDGGVQ